MDFFSKLTKAAIDVAVTPLEVVTDTVMAMSDAVAELQNDLKKQKNM